MRKKQTLTALLLSCVMLALCACSLLPGGSGASPFEALKPSATPEPELDGSVFMDYLRDQTESDYYALIPGENGEAMLLLASGVSYHEAGVDAEGTVYPEDGYYAPDANFLRYESGIVQYVDFFHSATDLTIDRENRILYRTWIGHGIYQDIATSYPRYTLAQWSSFYDSIERSIDDSVTMFSHNEEPFSEEEYEQIYSERQASRVAIQFFEIDRDNLRAEPQMCESDYITVDPGDAVMRGDTLYLTFTKYAFEAFPVDVIRDLKEGDIITMEGIPVRVESVEINDELVEGEHFLSVNINQSYWLNSVGGRSDLLTHVGTNDDYYFQPTGTDTLPVDDAVSFYDYAEPAATWNNGNLEPLVVPYDEIADYFSRETVGLTAEIRRGTIVSMQREWHP